MQRAFELEDNHSMRILLSAILAKLDFEVTAAGSVREARQLLETIPAPEIALLDYHLPDGRGLEIAMLLRERFGSKVQIISVSAGDMELEESWDLQERKSYDKIARKPATIKQLEGIISIPGDT